MQDEAIAKMYDDLQGLSVELDADPAARGPGYLQDLISKTRGYLNKTSHYMAVIHREMHHVEMELEALEAAYQVASDELMSNDRTVRQLPAIQDRVAMINVMLAVQRREISAKKREVKNLQHVEKVVRHRHKELDNTMSAIRLQRSLLETEIRTGSFYGDEGEQSRGTKWPKVLDETIDSDDLDRMLEEVQAEAAAKMPRLPEMGTAAEVVEDPPEPVPAPEPVVVAPVAPVVDQDEADMLALLEQGELVVEESAIDAPQPVVAEPPSAPKKERPEPPPDAEIDSFLSEGEDDVAELFKDL